MVKPVSVIFKSFTRKLTGKTGEPKLRGKIDTKSLRSAYEVLIRHKQENIQRYGFALSQLVVQIEIKKNSLNNVTSKINKLKNILVGVKNKLDILTVELQQSGKSQEEIEQHSDYIRLQSDYNAFQSNLDQKNARFTKLQQDIIETEDKAMPFKLQFQQLKLEIVKIQEERDDTIHDHLSILIDKEIADVLAGIR